VFKGLSTLNIGEGKIPNTLASGFIMLVRLNNSSFYGLSGGVGHIHLKKNCKIEPRFGITLAEVILSFAELKGLEQKDTSGEVNYLNRAFRGRYNPDGDFNNLKRVLTNVRGSLRKGNEFYEEIGRSIQASDALSVNGAKTFIHIFKLLVIIDELWVSGEKKMSIPQLEHINKKFNSELLETLEKELIRTLCNYSQDDASSLFLDNEEIGYLPDRVEKYNLIFDRRRRSAESYEGVFEHVREKLESLDVDEQVTAFQRMSLELEFDDGTTEKRQLFYFICGDIEYDNNVYFANNKLWFRASDEYIDKLDFEIDNIEHITPENLDLIEWDVNRFAGQRAENQYNSENTGFLLMDCRLVKIADERGGIEFCDLLKENGGEIQLVHVKHDCGAALRALFAQGFVSAKLYAESDEFRQNVHSCQLTGVDDTFRTSADSTLRALSGKHRREIKVIFAIFDNKNSHKVPTTASTTSDYLNGTLTTFAKVDLLERVNSIRSMGYGVAITRIRPYPRES
jgi:uncharacterized protein (TIGR04141 family)